MKYTVSIHTKHDANMTISTKSTIVSYIEFEKVVGKRYFKFATDEGFAHEFNRYIFPFLENIAHEIEKINFCWLTDFQKMMFINAFPNCIFEEKKHHISHAYSLYAFTHPQPTDLVVSFDGGGDEEDCFKLFHWENERLHMIKEIKLNLGTPYRILGLVSEEIKSDPIFEYETNLHLPGKIMGLAPLGKIEPSFIPAIERFYLKFRKEKTTIYEKIKGLLEELNLQYTPQLKVDNTVARNILQTSQKVFEDLFFENTKEIFEEKYHRILLVGGCSLNIKLNTSTYVKTQKEVFVSPVSGDCGISLGASLSTMNLQDFSPFQHAFIGLACTDSLTPYLKQHPYTSINTEKLAELLFNGKVIATFIDRIEAGARSLGNRSLLASPLQKGMKDKLNKIKEREFFRPVAPIVSIEMQEVYFEKVPTSKYMSFSPMIKPEYKNTLAEIVHYDDTCRIQTATPEEDFIYPLLKAFGKYSGTEVLINTSFNVKGKPILNHLHEAFDLLKNTEIDGLYINGLLFEK